MVAFGALEGRDIDWGSRGRWPAASRPSQSFSTASMPFSSYPPEDFEQIHTASMDFEEPPPPAPSARCRRQISSSIEQTRMVIGIARYC